MDALTKDLLIELTSIIDNLASELRHFGDQGQFDDYTKRCDMVTDVIEKLCNSTGQIKVSINDKETSCWHVGSRICGDCNQKVMGEKWQTGCKLHRSPDNCILSMNLLGRYHYPKITILGD